MRSFYAIVLCAYTSIQCLSAQNEVLTNFQLVDGSVLWGIIVEENRESFFIKTIFNDELSIDKILINRMFSENIVPTRKGRFFFVKGDYVEISTGLGIESNSSNAMVAFGLDYYTRLSPKFDFGGGVSYKHFDLWDGFISGNGNFLSPTLNAKWYITEGVNRLYLSGKIGYGFELHGENSFNGNIDEISNGVAGEIALGNMFCSRRITRFFVEYRVNFQQSTQMSNNNFDPSVINITTEQLLSRTGIAIGMRF